MPQRASQTIRVKFNKGLLTEFTELDFPTEASVDELNCDLFKAGNRTKRLGMNYEDDFELSTDTYSEGSLFHVGTWVNVGDNASLEYLVVQVSNKLRFYRKGAVPLSSGAVPVSDVDPTEYQINLSDYNAPGGTGASSSKVDMAAIEGGLVVVSPQIESIYITRDNSTGIFTVEQIEHQIRDLGVYSDPDLRFEDVASPSAQRIYDTENAGWTGTKGDAALITYETSQSAYPALTHPWYSGKDSGGNFSVTEWQALYTGTSLTTVGNKILDLFNPVRSITTYYDGKPIKDPVGRFVTAEAYAGRMWYAGVDSRVYYSQIIEDTNQLGDCYSHNDPTAEYTSDVLATDGGYVRLPEANGIKKLHVFGSSLLIFADNGVWRISGIDGNIFKAEDFSVFKISDFGLAFRDSFVGGQNSVPFWWSYVGIHTVQVTESGGMVEVNLTRDTIQTFWDDIGANERGFVSSAYDALDNQIVWMYPNKGETVEFKLNNILFLDADLGAFYPWKVSDSDGQYFAGAGFFNGKGNADTTVYVIDEDGNQVQAGGNDVVVSAPMGSLASSNLFFLTRDTSGSLTFSEFRDEGFLDWGSANYEAYAETAYNFIGDLGRRKTSPFITVFMRQTETGFTLVDGLYQPIKESSLKISAYWDFKVNPATSSQEAYRHKGPIVPESLSSFPSPTTVLSTRLKLRGRGRVVKLRFEGSEGKDFNLLGWETLDAVNDKY